MHQIHSLQQACSFEEIPAGDEARPVLEPFMSSLGAEGSNSPQGIDGQPVTMFRRPRSFSGTRRIFPGSQRRPSPSRCALSGKCHWNASSSAKAIRRRERLGMTDHPPRCAFVIRRYIEALLRKNPHASPIRSRATLGIGAHTFRVGMTLVLGVEQGIGTHALFFTTFASSREMAASQFQEPGF